MLPSGDAPAKCVTAGCEQVWGHYGKCDGASSRIGAEAARMGVETPPRKPQRVRAQDERERTPAKRRCQKTLTLPDRTGEGEMIFTCNRARHEVDPEEHIENGRIRGKDGNVRIYRFSWYDATDGEVWRAR